jgi:hypothetical protein
MAFKLVVVAISRRVQYQYKLLLLPAVAVEEAVPMESEEPVLALVT